MLDIKFIRENTDLIKEAARKKHIKFNIDELISLDEKRLALLKEVEEIRARQNIESEAIAKMMNTQEKFDAIGRMKILKDGLGTKEGPLKEMQTKWEKLMLEVPNVPDPSVPDGDSDAENMEVEKWGDLPTFNFPIKGHVELIEKLGLADFERGTKVAGYRGYFLTGAGAKLSLAVLMYAFGQLTKKDFIPILAPSMMRPESFVGTGWLPQGEEEVYKNQDGDYYAGTAEVPMMGFHAGEILEEKDLPKKYVAFSPCFRREAGSHGKDTKGLYRVHEFYKIEQVVLCKADHQESVKFHEELTLNAKKIMQALKLPYHVVLNCGGDLGLGQVKKYDIEAWFPSESRYRETHSASYFHDFQTRRLNIRYRDSEGKIRFAHSLNNTAAAAPRIILPIIENYQQEDGSVMIPEVLRPYLGTDRIF